jgi:modification methylase
VVLDPFFGTGTTGAVAKKLHRHWIGIEQDETYVRVAQQRIDAVAPPPDDKEAFKIKNPRKRRRIPFGTLLAHGLLEPGQALYFGKDGDVRATVAADGGLLYNGARGSIHQIGAHIKNAPSCNGWTHWYYIDPETGARRSIDALREHIRAQIGDDAF